MNILIGSIPTVQTDDLELASRTIKKQENITNSAEVLEDRLKNIFNNKRIFLFNRGREALYFALQTLGISNGDEVIVQAMTCIAVVNPILWIGAAPVYADINSQTLNIDLLDLEKKITNKTKAIIVQHTFGNIADIKKIGEIAKRHNIYVIEDCAHLFYSEYENTDINKYSDISFFSFAQDKSISCVQGGLAVINNPQLFDKADSMYLNIEDQTDEQASYNARYIRLWSIIKKYYFTPLLPFPKRITLGKVLVLLYRKLHLIKQQATKELEKSPAINRLSDIQSTLLLNQIEKCERFNEHRKEVAQIYSEELNDGLLKQSNGNPLLRYPILVDNPSELLRELRNRKYICGRWYNSIVFPLKQNMVEGVGYVSGSCPNAEVITKKIINLPTSVDMGIEDAKEISKIVNTFGKPFKFNNLENHA